MVANQKMLSCEQVWPQVSNYLDGEVDAALRPALEEHFRTCPRCASVLAGARNVVQLYGDERMLEVPAGFGQRLEKRLEKRLNKNAGARWSSWSAWLVPVAALALIAGGLQLANSHTFRNFIQSQQAEPANNIPPDLVVVVSDGSKIFHVAGCPYIHDKASERTLTAKEAMQDGFVPCTRCLRQYLKTGLSNHSDEDDASAEAVEDEDEVLSASGR
jgi:hypothetical protein